MEQPKISIIVPVYKVELYLRKCLDSIVNQTYHNLEIILVDDGSPDGCGAICDEYAEKDSRIIVIHQKNAGVSAARNAGLDIATGEYIGFVDSDDWIELDMYAYLMELALTFDAHISQCGYYFDEENCSTQMYTTSENQMAQGGNSSFSSDDWHKLSHANWNKLYRADVVNDLRFDKDYAFGEDILFNVQLIQRTKKVCFGSQAKYHYVQRQGSACYQPITLEYLNTRPKAFERIVALTQFDPVAYTYFFGSLVKEKLDACSKIVRFFPTEISFRNNSRHFVRKHLTAILKIHTISVKDRIKCILIAYAWWLYHPMLLLSKLI